MRHSQYAGMRFIVKTDFRLSGRPYTKGDEFDWSRLPMSNRTISILIRKGHIEEFVEKPKPAPKKKKAASKPKAAPKADLPKEEDK